MFADVVKKVVADSDGNTSHGAGSKRRKSLKLGQNFSSWALGNSAQRDGSEFGISCSAEDIQQRTPDILMVTECDQL